jgi:hypothetical protein
MWCGALYQTFLYVSLHLTSTATGISHHSAILCPGSSNVLDAMFPGMGVFGEHILDTYLNPRDCAGTLPGVLSMVATKDPTASISPDHRMEGNGRICHSLAATGRTLSRNPECQRTILARMAREWGLTRPGISRRYTSAIRFALRKEPLAN